MKKTLLLLASAALLLAGCAKEQVSKQVEGDGLQTYSFTVGIVPAATKAVADGDGAAAKVNHWIMEVLDSDGDVYNRQEEDGTVGEKTHTFNVPLIKGQTYNVLFWADTKDNYNTASLREISKAVYTANADALDAFSAVVSNFSTTQATQQQVTLKRPFAQLNVIFTDLAKLYSTMGTDAEYSKFKPVDFVAKAKVPTTFDVLNQQAGAPAESPVSLTAAKDYIDNYDSHTAKETLFMDYIFASKDSKDIVDIDFSFKSKGVAISHNFTSIPFQRNYRTNILGEFMSAGAQWNVVIDPTWDSLDDGSKDYNVLYYEASSISDAQNYIQNSDEQKSKAVDLSNATITNDDVATDGTIHFELKTTSPADMVNFTLPAIPDGVTCSGWTIEHQEGYPTQNVNVTAPAGTSVTIDAPSSHVTLNGVEYEQVTATTGNNTLVVPQGVTVDELIVKKGAVEIHGTVNTLTVDPEDGQKVVFRECEGLSEAVFAAIKGEGHDYIDYPMYTYKKVGDVYSIYKLPVIAKIGDVEYPSIAAALDAVPAENTEPVTIKVVSDVVLKKADALTINKNNVIIDGQNFTIALDQNDEALSGYADSKYGQFKMITVSGKNVTLRDMTLDAKQYRGASLATTIKGDNIVYENIVYNGKGSAHYYGTSGNGKITFKKCKVNTCGYGIHSDTATSGIVIEDCEIHGWNAFGDKVTNVSVKDSKFYGAEDSKNGTLAALSIYCPTIFTDCTFSQEFISGGTYEGIFMSKAALVSLNGCSVEGGELYQMARTDDDWDAGSVIAIDATGNAADGFTAGTFVAIQASDIKVAGANEAVAVEGKENVYTIVPKPVASFGGKSYYKLEDALSAALTAKGGEVKLLEDVTLSKSWDCGTNIGDDRDVYSFTLDLNGKTIYRGDKNYNINLCDNNWTVVDKTGNGTINKKSSGSSKLSFNCCQGHDPFMTKMAKFETCPTFVVNGGKFEGQGDLSNLYTCEYGVDFSAGGTGDNHMAICKFEINAGTVRNMRVLNGQGEIKGGKFGGQILIWIDDTKYTQFGIQNSDFLTTISGGEFTMETGKDPFIFQSYASSANLKITGGTFNFNPSVKYSNCIPTGYEVKDNQNGTWSVVAAN